MEWHEWEPEADNFEQLPRDQAIDAAKGEIESFFQEKSRRTRVYYLTQLQVIFERDFFHWITGKAVTELVNEGRLSHSFGVLQQNPGEQGSRVRFIFHPSCRSTKRQIVRKIKLIRKFSAENVGRAAGRQAEILFSRSLMRGGFKLVEENTKEYNGRVWTETAHDLDYVFEADGLAYGCEIKNRFEYIPHVELQIKVKICRHLGIIPLFIVRWAPKSYIEEVARSGEGFTLVFQTHIYPQGLEDLITEIKNEFEGLPVDCPKDIPGSILNRFLAWHRKHSPT
jgi:hypothetical protein